MDFKKGVFICFLFPLTLIFSFYIEWVLLPSLKYHLPADKVASTNNLLSYGQTFSPFSYPQHPYMKQVTIKQTCPGKKTRGFWWHFIFIWPTTPTKYLFLLITMDGLQGYGQPQLLKWGSPCSCRRQGCSGEKYSCFKIGQVVWHLSMFSNLLQSTMQHIRV